jgi:hypothetical protein
MVRYLGETRQGGASLFDQELNGLEPHRRRILLVVGSYEEARAVREALEHVLPNRPDPPAALVLGSGLNLEHIETEPSARSVTLLRNELASFASRGATYLIAPLLAIERGHNILASDPDGTEVAAFGSVYFLVRPYPRPGDLHTTVQRLNSWALQRIAQTDPNRPAGDVAWGFRTDAQSRWRRLLMERRFEMDPADNSALLWTQMVLVWQCIGRLLRGGVRARVHFVDAKWARNSSNLTENAWDDECSSFLVGFQTVLHEALSHPDPAHQALTEALYGPLYRALVGMKGVYHENV